jgi:hypothetical protein
MSESGPALMPCPGHDLGDDELITVVLEALWGSVDVWNARALTTWLAEANPGQRAVLAASWCDAEINNGGFAQLFMNSTGSMYADGVAGYARLGAEAQGALLVQAADLLLGGDVPLDHKARLDRLERVSETVWTAVETLDSRYDRIPAARSARSLAVRYIRSHLHEFFRPPPEQLN